MLLEYAAFAVWCFTVALAGGLVGLVLGNLRLPLVLLLAASPASGAGTNLGISAVSAATASVAHVRAGRINWRLFAWMAPPSIVGAVLGGYLSGRLPSQALLLAIAAVLLYSGIDLLRWDPPAPADDDAATPDIDIPAAVATGGVIGLLGGFVGLILGSLRMPALLRIVHETPARAVGTNVTVGFCVGVAGALAHLPDASPDWGLLALGAAASIPGALLGSRLTGRLSPHTLVRAIAVILLVVGVAVAVQALA
ncbi:MAG TPA: sulfite exporter TauE/SafE family protein [Solirubrobacteraceae bacterium]|nr:sulfite exporter TauE/SafE family protein [Solirubrobacteraceae bacterium]